MSPEVLAECGHDMQSDWWSLGIVLYELATGQPPFQSSNLDAMADNIRFSDLPTNSVIKEELEDLIDRLTHKLPERRLGQKNGAKEIKNHPFFKGVDWNAVL
jgi:serine/threonine protein kinase